jgi:hypothetical protein
MRVLGPWHDWLAEPLSRDHIVQVYSDDASLTVAVATYAGAGLGKGETAVVIATREHADAVRAHLSADGFETADLERWGQLRFLEAREVLDDLLVGGRLDGDQFQVMTGGLIGDARRASRNGRVRLYGEMVNLLWARGEEADALRLEELWSLVIPKVAVPLFCAYRVDDEAALASSLRDVHTHVVPIHACA